MKRPIASTLVLRCYCATVLVFCLCLFSSLYGQTLTTESEPQPVATQPQSVAAQALATATTRMSDETFKQEFSETCRSAIDHYEDMPIEEMLAQSRHDLKEEVKALLYMLNRNPDRKNADGWTSYLKLNELQKMLLSQSDDEGLINDAIDRFRCHATCFQHPDFVKTFDALENYRFVLDAPRHAQDRKKDFTEACEYLLDSMDTILHNCDPGDAENFSATLDYVLQQQPQSEYLAKMRKILKTRFSTPNLQVDLSSRVLLSDAVVPIDQPTTVKENVRGTVTSGTGTVKGIMRAVLADNPRQAEIDLLFDVNIDTKTVGWNQGVSVYSTNKGHVTGRKSIFAGFQLSSAPASVKGESDVKITNVDTGRGQIGTRIAYQRINEEFPYSKAESIRLMEYRFAEEINARVEGYLNEGAEPYKTLVRNFTGNGIGAESFTTSSTKDYLFFQSLIADDTQIGPCSDIQSLTPHDLTAKVHESVINNTVYRICAGNRLTEVELRNALMDHFPSLGQVLGNAAEGNENAPSNENILLLFSNVEPFIVRLNNNELKVTIQLDGIEQDKVRLPAMDITIVYALETRDVGFALVKKEIEAWPVDVDPGTPLPVRYQSFRPQIIKRIDTTLKNEYVINGSPVPTSQIAMTPQEGQSNSFILPEEFRFKDGWAVAGFKFIPDSKK